jgi:hypothetical protein
MMKYKIGYGKGTVEFDIGEKNFLCELLRCESKFKNVSVWTYLKMRLDRILKPFQSALIIIIEYDLCIQFFH